jgi:hypothetical protein
MSVPSIKAERIVQSVGASPVELNELQLADTRRSMEVFLHEHHNPSKLDPANEVNNETNEQGKDRKPIDKRENPKAGRKFKPQRKGDTQETDETEGE